MKYYAYDSNSDLHHLGACQSHYFARQKALELFGEQSLKSSIVLSESQLMTSAVTARLLSDVTPKSEIRKPTKVITMTTHGGNPAAEQRIIVDGEGNRTFQSFNSLIATKDRHGKVTLDETYWDYSRTTTKYLRQFINDSSINIRQAIDQGQFKLANLNGRN